MKKLLLGTALISVLTTACWGQAVRIEPRQGSADIWGGYFDASHKITFSGRVTGVEKVRPTSAQYDEVTLLVRNKDGGGTASVDLGPSWFVDHQTTKIKVGDNVQVTGSKAMIDGHGMILASMIRLRGQGGPVLALRRLSGKAYWVGTEVAANNTPPSGPNVVNGTITGFSPYTVNDIPYQSAVLQTENGLLNIDLGPQWYYGNQNVNYQIGQGVSVVVGWNPISVGPNMQVLPTQMVYGAGNTYTIRNPNGVPTYYWGQ